jgi:lipopolysaccharide export system protein LptA
MFRRLSFKFRKRDYPSSPPLILGGLNRGCFFRRDDKKRIFRIFIPLPLLLLVYLAPSPCSGENRAFETKGPIVINSTSLTADNKAHTALFEGSVTARTDNGTISSDSMLVSYAEGGSVTRIDARGHVKLVRGDRVITSEAATYFADDEKVIFTGEPRATEGGNVVSGTKMTYLMKEDRSIVENPKVFLENKKAR